MKRFLIQDEETGEQVTCWLTEFLCETCELPLATDGKKYWCSRGQCPSEGYQRPESKQQTMTHTLMKQKMRAIHATFGAIRERAVAIRDGEIVRHCNEVLDDAYFLLAEFTKLESAESESILDQTKENYE